MQDQRNGSNSVLSDLLAGSSFIFLGKVLNLGVGFVGNILIARFLGAASFGSISLGLLLMTIVGTLGGLSTKTGLSRYIPRMETQANQRGIIKSAFAVTIPLSIFIGAITFTGADLIADKLFNNAQITTELQIFSLGIPVYVLANNLKGIIRGAENVRAQIVIDNLSQPILKLVFIAVAISIGAGVAGVGFAYVGAFCSSVILSYLWLRRYLPNPFQGSFFQFSELYRYSIPLVFTNLMTISFARIDRLFLGYYASTAVVGVYDAIYQLGAILLVATTAFNFLFFPRFSKLHSNEQIDQMQSVFQTSTKWLISATLPLFLVMVLFPETIIRYTYGSEFLSGSLVLLIISIGIFSHVVSGLNRSTMKAIGATKKVTYGTAIAFIGNIALNFILVPLYGGDGAALATAGSYVLWNVYYLILLYRDHSLSAIEMRPLGILLVLTAGYLLLGKIGKQILGAPGIFEMIIYVVFIFITYPILLYASGIIGETERQIIAGMLS